MHQLTIMMATYNGAEFISEQLASLERQGLAAIRLIVSDDASTDDTLNIVRHHCEASEILDLEIIEGPRAGFAANFRNLVLTTEPETEYFAFCDQDDIWFDKKSRHSLDWLKTINEDTPAIYSGRTQIMSRDGKVTGELSPLFRKPPCFLNALVQSIAGANTMTMNRAAFNLLRDSMAHGTPVSHDWWSYMMVTGVGGVFRYDPEPMVNYRQHAGNLVGSNNSFTATIKRIKMALGGRFHQWNRENINILEKCADMLSTENQIHLVNFQKIREAGMLGRINMLYKSGIHRQTAKDQFMLWTAAILGKL